MLTSLVSSSSSSSSLEVAAIVTLIASLIYLLGFFGIDFVQSFISRASHYDDAVASYFLELKLGDCKRAAEIRHQWLLIAASHLLSIKKLLRENRFDDIVDGNMKTYDEKEVGAVIQVALLCTQSSPEDRPTMAEVVRLLQGVDLAERWAECEQLEDVRSREFSLLSHQFAWAEETTHDQVAIQLSKAR